MDLLQDAQFEIDGVPFGVDMPVMVDADGFNPGRAELLTSRAKIGGGDGVRPGIDFYGSATWSFRLVTNTDDEEQALEAYSRLAAAWPTEGVRLTPGRVSTLRYRLGGRTRVVYGRGGRWTPAVTNTLWSGALAAAADFETVDHLHYDDDVQTAVIPIAPVASGGTGTVLPVILPTALGTSPNGERVGEVIVGGERPTPVWLIFDGPVSNAQVISSSGWVCRIDDTVYDNDPVTVDARPFARSAVRESGGGVQLNPRVTKISKMYLPPGAHTLTFTGIDPTGTASVAVNWRSAHHSL